MFSIRYATESDTTFWLSLDEDIGKSELILKIRDRRGYVIYGGDKQVVVMRYNLMWDVTPFLTLIYIIDTYRGQGFGEQAMLYWENEMRDSGYKMVMTSTQVDEQAQHFYRKHGYLDRGCLILDNTPLGHAQEMFMLKVL